MHFKSIPLDFKKGIATKKVINGIILCLIFTLYNCKVDDEIIYHNTLLKLYSVGNNTFNITYDIQGKPIIIGDNAINYNSSAKITIIDPNYYFTYDKHNNINTISAISNTMYSLEDASIKYNEQGLLQEETISYIQTSKPNTTIDIVRNFTYDENQKLIEILEKSPKKNKTNSFKKQLIYYDNKGNITKIEQFESSNNEISYHRQHVSSFTYDTKKNPFFHLLLDAGVSNNYTKLQYFGIPSISLGLENLKLQYYSKNNLLSVKKIMENGDINTVNYQYQYNTDNLPISLIKTAINSKTGISRQHLSWLYEK